MGVLCAYIAYIAFLHFAGRKTGIILLYVAVGVAGVLGGLAGYKASLSFIIMATTICGSFAIIM